MSEHRSTYFINKHKNERDPDVVRDESIDAEIEQQLRDERDAEARRQEAWMHAVYGELEDDI